MLKIGRSRAEVQAAEQQCLQSGITSTPSVVINRKYGTTGRQTAAFFERSLRQISAEASD